MIEPSKPETADAKLTCGMVGGGEGAFIGDVHRRVLAFDGLATLVSGAFSRDFDNTLATGKRLGLERSRLYESYEVMAREEGKRSDKIDFVVIVTPNHLHYPITKAFLENGISVVCDKPFVFTSKEAEELTNIARERKLLVCVTYTYNGYPMAKQAKRMIANGEIGDVRFVSAEYIQEWLSTPVEREGNRQAAWRTDPKQTGLSSSVGDIGTHTENIVSYLTGLEIESVCARLDTFVEGRRLDDNASIMVNFKGGARGLYWVSQVAVGHDNDLRIRIVGSKGSIEWAQEDPNYLKVSYLDKPSTILSRGRDKMYPEAEAYSRVPGGHPEGYYEAFANVYRSFCTALAKSEAGETIDAAVADFPDIDAGSRGVRFIERCVESSKKGGAWVSF